MERFRKRDQLCGEKIVMPYTVIIENRAQKEFHKLNPPFDKNIRKAINALEHNPRHNNVKKLSGTKDGYRVRVADYRVLYTIDDNKKLVTIYRIRHRKDVYE